MTLTSRAVKPALSFELRPCNISATCDFISRLLASICSATNDAVCAKAKGGLKGRDSSSMCRLLPPCPFLRALHELEIFFSFDVSTTGSS